MPPRISPSSLPKIYFAPSFRPPSSILRFDRASNQDAAVFCFPSFFSSFRQKTPHSLSLLTFCLFPPFSHFLKCRGTPVFFPPSFWMVFKGAFCELFLARCPPFFFPRALSARMFSLHRVSQKPLSSSFPPRFRVQLGPVSPPPP